MYLLNISNALPLMCLTESTLTHWGFAGDRLNFGMAAEQAKAGGLKVCRTLALVDSM